MAGGDGSPVKPLTGNTGGNADLHGMDGVVVNKSLLELAAAGQSVNMLECRARSDCSSIQPRLKPLSITFITVLQCDSVHLLKTRQVDYNKCTISKYGPAGFLIFVA